MVGDEDCRFELSLENDGGGVCSLQELGAMDWNLLIEKLNGQDNLHFHMMPLGQVLMI